MVEFKRKLYKKQGKACLKGKVFQFLCLLLITVMIPLTPVWISMLSFVLISTFIIIYPFTLLVSYFIMVPLTLGLYKYCLNAVENKQSIADIFYVFKSGHYFHIIWVYFIMTCKIFLWTMLFVVPGIIKSYEYFMIPYILMEQPDIPTKDVFRLSKLYTNNHKMDLFVMGLSFILWMLLVTVTFGLAIFYVSGYQYLSFTYAYLDLKNNEKEKL